MAEVLFRDLVLSEKQADGEWVIASAGCWAYPRMPAISKAVIAANNLIVFGTLVALSELKSCVPEDMAVVSFDEIPENLIPAPFLTVVSQPPYEMGKKATEIMIKRIKGGMDNNNDFQEIVLPVNLIKRASSESRIKT